MSATVRMPGPPNRGGYVAFVSLDGSQSGAVRVRRKARADDPWVCDACGEGNWPHCDHLAAAAAHVAALTKGNRR